MIKKFEPGKIYVWIGPKYFDDNWNQQMDAWKDGKPRKCTRNFGPEPNRHVGFENIEKDWDYRHTLKHFKEVKGLILYKVKQEELEL